MNLVILSPEKEIYKGEVSSVKVPGTSGQFEVLNNHAPIVSSLEKGVAYIKPTQGEVMEISIVKGFIEVLNNEVALLVQQS